MSSPNRNLNVDKESLLPGKCTLCCKKINFLNFHKCKRHPVLNVLLCERCYGYYSSRERSCGLHERCTWCHKSGRLLRCTFCPRAFCQSCINKNVDKSEFCRTLNADENHEWRCYVCEPYPILPLVDRCSHIFSIVKNLEWQPSVTKLTSEQPINAKVLPIGSLLANDVLLGCLNNVISQSNRFISALERLQSEYSSQYSSEESDIEGVIACARSTVKVLLTSLMKLTVYKNIQTESSIPTVVDNHNPVIRDDPEISRHYRQKEHIDNINTRTDIVHKESVVSNAGEGRNVGEILYNRESSSFESVSVEFDRSSRGHDRHSMIEVASEIDSPIDVPVKKQPGRLKKVRLGNKGKVSEVIRNEQSSLCHNGENSQEHETIFGNTKYSTDESFSSDLVRRSSGDDDRHSTIEVASEIDSLIVKKQPGRPKKVRLGNKGNVSEVIHNEQSSLCCNGENSQDYETIFGNTKYSTDKSFSSDLVRSSGDDDRHSVIEVASEIDSPAKKQDGRSKKVDEGKVDKDLRKRKSSFNYNEESFQESETSFYSTKNSVNESFSVNLNRLASYDRRFTINVESEINAPIDVSRKTRHRTPKKVALDNENDVKCEISTTNIKPKDYISHPFIRPCSVVCERIPCTPTHVFNKPQVDQVAWLLPSCSKEFSVDHRDVFQESNKSTENNFAKNKVKNQEHIVNDYFSGEGGDISIESEDGGIKCPQKEIIYALKLLDEMTNGKVKKDLKSVKRSTDILISTRNRRMSSGGGSGSRVVNENSVDSLDSVSGLCRSSPRRRRPATSDIQTSDNINRERNNKADDRRDKLDTKNKVSVYIDHNRKTNRSGQSREVKLDQIKKLPDDDTLSGESKRKVDKSGKVKSVSNNDVYNGVIEDKWKSHNRKVKSDERKRPSADHGLRQEGKGNWKGHSKKVEMFKRKIVTNEDNSETKNVIKRIKLSDDKILCQKYCIKQCSVLCERIQPPYSFASEENGQDVHDVERLSEQDLSTATQGNNEIATEADMNDKFDETFPSHSKDDNDTVSGTCDEEDGMKEALREYLLECLDRLINMEESGITVIDSKESLTGAVEQFCIT